ncbi:dihydrodipicolinate synthase family protein [Amycolatopsis panacis]|uniref:Dihydrodipicolinate synthase family protein n=1 Tax=Amycolatopsis panacis TaxID=2340917 RepID=A0A419IAR5_9PSEU|nr:dihydrodipicolinate synthase family protein [Amycolatopsis panacis]RJQ91198.1 dihydrodipicolinate synthase family protein [Amycolatopsis panacis]
MKNHPPDHGKNELGGIMAALATPLSGDGSTVDRDSIALLVDYVVGGGVAGVIPCGSTGEFAALTMDERMEVVEAVAEAARSRVALIPHVGALRPADAAELTRHAAARGAAAVMAVPPFYDPLSWAEIVGYYAEIAAAAPGLPIMAYHYPSATGGRITAGQIDELTRSVPAVRYLKDSSGDAQLVDELLAHTEGSSLTVFNGSDSLTFQGLACGATGSVWGAATFMPRLAVEFFETVHERRDLEQGRRMWRKIRPICRLLEDAGYPAAVKAACELAGLPLGPTRAPLRPISAEAREQLHRLLDAAGLIDAARAIA